VRFDGEKKLHRLAVEVQGLTKAYDRTLFKNVDLMIEAGERVAIIGANGIGKTTLLRCIGGDDIAGLHADRGTVKWAEKMSVICRKILPKSSHQIKI
jgi:ATPase subunit of ABC transporter with duplicated ATPase domains